MVVRRTSVLALLFLAVLATAAHTAEPEKVAPAGDKPTLSFDRDIRPILAEHCIGCHGGDKPEGGFQLTSRESALKPTESGHHAIVPGKPGESEMIRRLTATGDERMPPAEKEPLKPAEIEKLRQWISAGANWSQHWAFQPLANVPAPQTADPWAINEIDRFVLAGLKAKGIKPSPEADRYTLIKRLSYDLLGLPPSVVDVDAFVNDKSPRAYETLIDKLLASPHFGERWGRHWLDLAHYADSDGYEKDRARPDAYLYRDWVIQAINRDLPFNQFTIEQIAGDLLPGATSQQRLATAFNRQTLTNEEGGVDQEEYRVAAVFDRTETLGTVFMGLTVGCCRCHTHKYDPLPHTDYYKLFAFYNDADEIAEQLPIGAQDMAALEAKLRPLESALNARYHALAPAEKAWSDAEHKKFKATAADKLVEQGLSLTSARVVDLEMKNAVQIAKDIVTFELPESVEKASYEIQLEAKDTPLTGLRVYALADDKLPGKGPGLAKDGNFVLTGLRAIIVEQGKADRPIELHRVVADYTAPNFTADKVLTPSSTGKTGWSVTGKTGETHNLTLRTKEALKLTKSQQLKLVLEQNHGDRALLGKLRIVGLSGDERGLEFAPDIASLIEMYPEKRVYKNKEKLFEFYVTQVARDAEVLRLRGEIAAVNKQYQAKLTEVRMIAQARLGRQTKVFHRGEFLSPTDAVEPGVPAVLGAIRPRGAKADRLDLARWLVSSDNSQTPRVAVNHVWKHLFGEGLVRSMTDFGVRGEPPTQPELLEWLARSFRDDLKWSRKQLIRTIVTSATYRQSSTHRPELRELDPLNNLLARQNRFRVEAEIVRDISLSVAGLLANKVGGPSVFPPMPEDLAKLSYANNFSWTSSSGDDRYRRGMYTFFKRTIPHPNLTTFDCPDANVACVARTVSNTPLQALALLNNESHVEAAQGLAKRVLNWQPSGERVATTKEESDEQPASAELDRARLNQALRVCVARPAAKGELDALQRVLDGARKYYRAHSAEAEQMAGPQRPKELAASESAAWVVAARVVLNLDEFITRE
jgi:mono/diheme cytochrome c family protein